MTTEHDPSGEPAPETPPAQTAPPETGLPAPEPEAAAAEDGPARLNSHNMLPPRERRRSGV